jgi:sugar phosphate isomerase/epimerase
MIVSCSTYGYRFLTLEGSLKRIAQLGFKAVDIMATRPHLLPGDYNDVKKVRDLLKSLGLAVSAVSAFDGHPQWHLSSANRKHREDTVGHVKSCVDLAVCLGSKVVQAITGMPLFQDIPFEDSWEFARASLKECAEYAGKNGIIISLEGEENNVVRTSQDIKRMIKEVDHRHLKALLEIGHANMMATDDPVCAIESLKDYIVHCHVHDNGGTYDDHSVPGDGTVHWKGVIDRLKGAGYNGYLALELLVSNPDEGSARGKHFLESLID